MVAVAARDAERFLAAPPQNIRLFLLHGNDAGGTTERARRVERIALQRGGGEAVMRFGSDEVSADPGRIVDEAYSASLFGGEPVISLRILDGRHNVMGAVQALLDRPPTASWLIMEAGELPRTSALRKAFEAAPHAAAIATYHAEGADLTQLIRAAATEAGLLIEPAALELLAGSLGGDRLATRGELEKLFLYVGAEGPIKPADVEAIVGTVLEGRSDEVIDAALLGDSEALEAGFERLRAEGGSAAALGAQSLRHLLQLQSLRALVDGGASLASAVERARPPVFSRRRAAIEAALQRWPSDRLAAARRQIAEAVLLTRLQSGLESAAISQALHALALESRRLRRRSGIAAE